MVWQGIQEFLVRVRNKKRPLAGLALVATCITVAACALYLTVRDPHVVAGLDHPDGPRVRLVQEFVGIEGFETTLYYDNGDGRWRWYYFDHDDSYWRHADAGYEGPEISIGTAARGAAINTAQHVVTITNDEIGYRQRPLSADIADLPSGLD